MTASTIRRAGPGLLRLRATRDTVHKGERFREGDTLVCEPAEAARLCQWGAFELTAEARARVYGRDPWARVTTR